MDFYCDAVPDLIFVHACPSLATVPMYSWPGVKFLLKGDRPVSTQAAFGNNLYVRAANGNSVNAH